MSKVKVNELSKHDASEITVNDDVVLASGKSVSSPSISTDTISEKTSAAGVTIDGVLIKDGQVDGVDVSTLSVDTNGLVLVHSSTFSEVSSKSIDSVFSSTYKNYRILLSIKSSTSGDFYFRFRDGSGDVTTSSYAWKYMFATNNNNWTAYDNGGSANKAEYVSLGGGNAYHYNNIFEIFNPNEAEKTTFRTEGNNASQQTLLAAGGFDGNTQFTGITFYNGSSATISGEIQIYGYAK